MRFDTEEILIKKNKIIITILEISQTHSFRLKLWSVGVTVAEFTTLSWVIFLTFSTQSINGFYSGWVPCYSACQQNLIALEPTNPT